MHFGERLNQPRINRLALHVPPPRISRDFHVHLGADGGNDAVAQHKRSPLNHHPGRRHNPRTRNRMDPRTCVPQTLDGRRAHLRPQRRQRRNRQGIPHDKECP